MNNEIILFFLCICIAVLICIVVYQQFVFRRGIQKQLKEISQKLEKIQDTDSDENIMMFTDEQALMELLVQINRLLEKSKKNESGLSSFTDFSKKDAVQHFA